MRLGNIFSQSIGIDLGTANTLVYVKGKGIVMREPSVVAIDNRSKKVTAVGLRAKEMFERTPKSIIAIRPLKDGVIADFEVTQLMLKYFIEKTLDGGKIVKPRIAVCIPAGVTSVEKKAVEEATLNAGAKKVKLIEEPMAAAIGAGLPVGEAIGNMIVDIGGGTAEIAVLSYGGIVVSESLRTAGDDMDVDIKEYVKWKYKLDIGLTTAETVKKTIGNATEDFYQVDYNSTSDIDEIDNDVEKRNTVINKDMYITGRDVVTGLPKKILIEHEEIRIALGESINNIINSIKRTLERTPPELAADLMVNGIVLTGGGALLKGLNMHIEKETGLKARIAENPLDCVAIGTGIVCEKM